MPSGTLKCSHFTWRRHNERCGVSNHRPLDCLPHRLFRPRSKKTSKLRPARAIHRWPVNSPHKGPVAQKMFQFDDVIMTRNISTSLAWSFACLMMTYVASSLTDMRLTIFVFFEVEFRRPEPILLSRISCNPFTDNIISNYILYKVWNEITYPFPNFNGCTIYVCKWTCEFIPFSTGHVNTYPCWD